MAQTKKSVNDLWQASFGERNEIKAGVNALSVGGETSGSVFQAMPIGTSATGTAVLVDLIGAESVSVTVGSIVVKSGTIEDATITGGTVGNLDSGSVVVTAGTVTPTNSVAAHKGTIEIATPESAGTVTAPFNGKLFHLTLVTPDMEGSGTATLDIVDTAGGTVFSQAQDESLTACYGSIVPVTTDMEFRAVADGTQSASVDVIYEAHYEK